MKYQSIILVITSSLLVACAATTNGGSASTAPASTGKAKPYPLKTCVVTDTGLHSMGSPISKTYGNQEIKFCCRPCIGKYEQNPERYNAKL